MSLKVEVEVEVGMVYWQTDHNHNIYEMTPNISTATSVISMKVLVRVSIGVLCSPLSPEESLFSGRQNG